MIDSMRLYQHRGIWYIYNKGVRRSLKTRDKRIAKGLFRDFQRGYLQREAQKLNSDVSMTITRFADLYIKARSDLSKATLRQDKIALNALAEHTGNIALCQIDRPVIDGFKSAQGMKPVSVNSYLRHIKAALNYAHEHGYIDAVPIIKLLKTGSALPRVISQADLMMIYQHATPEMTRIMDMALWTGARREELTRMRYEHKTGGMVRILGKGTKERVVPLVGKAKEIMAQQDIGWVFPYRHVSTYSNYFRETVRKAGVKARFHDLRHTAATNMLAHGVALPVVQKILGHASVTTTQIYADVLEKTLMDEMKKMEGK